MEITAWRFVVALAKESIAKDRLASDKPSKYCSLMSMMRQHPSKGGGSSMVLSLPVWCPFTLHMALPDFFAQTSPGLTIHSMDVGANSHSPSSKIKVTLHGNINQAAATHVGACTYFSSVCQGLDLLVGRRVQDKGTPLCIAGVSSRARIRRHGESFLKRVQSHQTPSVHIHKNTKNSTSTSRQM